MSWWTIEDLKLHRFFHQNQIALKDVWCIKEINTDLGHTVDHKELIIKSKDIELDFRTGAVWKSGQVAGIVENPDKLILFRRNWVSPSGKNLRNTIFIGMVDFRGQGLVARIRSDNNKSEVMEHTIGVPVSD
jgi:hypothetical protein